MKFICDYLEERLTRLRFNALGALQFEKDLRLLCDTIITECKSMNEDSENESRRFDSQIRAQFKRLRHWSYLLNLERAADIKEIPFPSPVLSNEEVKAVLKKRVEPDFFVGFDFNLL